MIVVGLGIVIIAWQLRAHGEGDERVVYIRSLDRVGFQYFATIDDVAATLESPTMTDEPNTRVFESLERLPVSLLSITTLSTGTHLPVFSFDRFLESNPAYTDTVFTIEIKDGMVTGAIEESLEE